VINDTSSIIDIDTGWRPWYIGRFRSAHEWTTDSAVGIIASILPLFRHLCQSLAFLVHILVRMRSTTSRFVLTAAAGRAVRRFPVGEVQLAAQPLDFVGSSPP